MNFGNLLFLLCERMIVGWICKIIVKSKGYPESENYGFRWGFWLGVIGVIVCARKSRYHNPAADPYRRIQKAKAANQRRQYRTTSAPQGDRKITPQNFTTKLHTLHNTEDETVTVSAAQKNLVSNARKYQEKKRKQYYTQKSGEVINIDLSWSENLAELLEATEVVYTNAQLNCSRRLLSERFDYYRDLHYRSYTAADLCYAKLHEILPKEKNVRRIVARLKDRNDLLRVSDGDLKQLESLRNTMGDICVLLKKRVEELNSQTGKIRDKIRDECGKKGYNWYEKLMERAGK